MAPYRWTRKHQYCFSLFFSLKPLFRSNRWFARRETAAFDHFQRFGLDCRPMPSQVCFKLR